MTTADGRAQRWTRRSFHKRETSHMKEPEDGDAPTHNFDEAVKGFKAMSTYVSGQYDKDEGFQDLLKHIEELEEKRGGGMDAPRNRVFYMALPPSVFTVVAKGLRRTVTLRTARTGSLSRSRSARIRVVPRDDGRSRREWPEKETYRIDHYLGKEMIKNMLVLRFGNVFLDACMNRNFIDNVQITFKEPSAPRAEVDTLTSLVSSVTSARTVSLARI